MRNLVMGGIGVLIGGFILIAGYMRKDPNPGGAYGTGMIVGQVFGWLFLVVGGIYFVLGIMEVQADMGGRDDDLLLLKKKRKKKRRPKPPPATPSVKQPAPAAKDEEDEWEDDDEDEPRAKRRPIHIHPLVWILGGAGVVVLLLALSCVWLYYFLSPTPSGMPPEAETDHASLVRAFGAEWVITVEARGAEPGTDEGLWAMRRTQEIMGELGSSLGKYREFKLPGKRMIMMYGDQSKAPNFSVENFAVKVDFGAVVDVTERKQYVVIDVDAPRLGQLAKAKGWYGWGGPPPRSTTPTAKAPERDKSEPNLSLVRIECRGLDKPVTVVDEELRKRVTKALPKAVDVKVYQSQKGIVVSLWSREPVAEIGNQLDQLNFARVTLTDERARSIVLFFTPEQVAALGGEPASAPPRDKPPESPPKPAEPPPSKPAEPSKPADSSPTRLTSLIAHWSFDEGEGDMVKDMSGNGIDLKLVGCKRGPGVRGQGVVMTGKDQYVDLGKDPRLNFGAGQAFTIAFWARTAERDGTALSFRNEASGAPVIDITWSFGRPEATLRSDGREIGEVRLRDASRPAPGGRGDGQWRHIAITRSGSGEIALFVNGTIVATGSPSRLSNTAGAITTNLRALGNERYHKLNRAPGNPDFIGSIDEVQIHGAVLSADQIRKLATK